MAEARATSTGRTELKLTTFTSAAAEGAIGMATQTLIVHTIGA